MDGSPRESREDWDDLGRAAEKRSNVWDWKKLSQRDIFGYRGGVVCGDGSRRIQAVSGAWRKVQKVIGDRHISRKLKGKTFSSCVTPAYQPDLETMAMTGKKQEKLQVCENIK